MLSAGLRLYALRSGLECLLQLLTSLSTTPAADAAMISITEHTTAVMIDIVMNEITCTMPQPLQSTSTNIKYAAHKTYVRY